jgi:hypothetical protein
MAINPTTLKALIDAQITNETVDFAITPAEVGGRMKDTVDYTTEQIAGISLLPGPQGPQGLQGVTGSDGAAGPTGDRYSSTTSTNFTVPVLLATATFTTGTDLAYTPTQTVIVSPTTTPNDHFHGTITSYSASTGIMSVECTEVNGAINTYNSWTVNLSGAVGVPGDTGPQGFQGFQGAPGIGGTREYYLNFGSSIISPSNAGGVTYYIGGLTDLPPAITPVQYRQIQSQVTGTLTEVAILRYPATITGSGEFSTFSIGNVSTGITSVISNAVQTNSTNGIWTNYTLSSPLAVNAGDLIQLVWITPVWVTAPTAVRIRANAKITY